MMIELFGTFFVCWGMVVLWMIGLIVFTALPGWFIDEVLELEPLGIFVALIFGMAYVIASLIVFSRSGGLG
jgi:F0F1-type ATP synthase assembly protein I